MKNLFNVEESFTFFKPPHCGWLTAEHPSMDRQILITPTSQRRSTWELNIENMQKIRTAVVWFISLTTKSIRPKTAINNHQKLAKPGEKWTWQWAITYWPLHWIAWFNCLLMATSNQVISQATTATQCNNLKKNIKDKDKHSYNQMFFFLCEAMQ